MALYSHTETALAEQNPHEGHRTHPLGLRPFSRIPRGPSRPFLPKGRYIYNAYFRRRDSGEFQDALQDGLVDVARQAGIEVT